MTLKELLYKKLRAVQSDTDVPELDQEIDGAIKGLSRQDLDKASIRVLGWAEEFYPGKYGIISETLEIKKDLKIKEAKK